MPLGVVGLGCPLANTKHCEQFDVVGFNPRVRFLAHSFHQATSCFDGIDIDALRSYEVSVRVRNNGTLYLWQVSHPIDATDFLLRGILVLCREPRRTLPFSQRKHNRVRESSHCSGPPKFTPNSGVLSVTREPTHPLELIAMYLFSVPVCLFDHLTYWNHYDLIDTCYWSSVRAKTLQAPDSGQMRSLIRSTKGNKIDSMLYVQLNLRLSRSAIFLGTFHATLALYR